MSQTKQGKDVLIVENVVQESSSPPTPVVHNLHWNQAMEKNAGSTNIFDFNRCNIASSSNTDCNETEKENGQHTVQPSFMSALDRDNMPMAEPDSTE
jgi:hypothetical protein